MDLLSLWLPIVLSAVVVWVVQRLYRDLELHAVEVGHSL